MSTAPAPFLSTAAGRTLAAVIVAAVAAALGVVAQPFVNPAAECPVCPVETPPVAPVAPLAPVAPVEVVPPVVDEKPVEQVAE